MASNLNSEFNYRYQVIGETQWEKLKTLQNFLEGRKRAEALEEVSRLKLESKIEELKYLQSTNAPLHVILSLKAELIETTSAEEDLAHAFELNKKEVAILEKLIAELYVELEPTRIAGYSDDEMFEVNAVNEFTTVIVREIQSEIIATGAPSPAKIKNAMSNPITWATIKNLGLIPKEIPMLIPSINPINVGFTLLNTEYIEKLENKND